jgi:hypothetical protein
MKSMHLTNKLGKVLLVLSLLFGIGITASTTAQAQWQNDRYNRNDDYNRQRAYEREQRRRQREARREARRRNRNNDDNDWNRNNDRNNDWSRDNDWNRRNGRSNDGYGNYGGSFDLRQTALNAGANEGIKEGRRDRERGERFDYTDESKYREATTDYSSRLGDRSAFQRYFREAFVTGYTEGYRGY